MPRIELIPEVLYGPLDPIHWEIDNLPLKAILRRQNLINLSLDNVLEEMRNAIGTQGSLANRLNQSLDEDGDLKPEAIDEAMHSIEEHTDTDLYVRMTRDESEKLANISNDATNVKFEIYTDDISFIEFNEGTLKIKSSTTISPIFESPDIIRLNVSFPLEAAHQHYYNLTPVDSNQITPDYKNYLVTSTATPFMEDSLRVYVNGIRIYSDAEVYAPGNMANDAWTLLSFTADNINGTFELSSALSDEDVIKIDFDVALL